MTNNDFGRCVVCGGAGVQVLFAVETHFREYQVIQCNKCKLSRTYPLLNYDSIPEAAISEYYGKSSNKFLPILQIARNWIMRSRVRNCLQFISDVVEKPKVLDVGCAEGRFLNAFFEYGCECWGVEHPFFPSKRFLNRDGIFYQVGDLCEINLPDKAFNLIIIWHVLEHLDDPHQVMRRLYELLAPNGVIFLAVPNFSSIEARKFLQSWFHLDIPWHKYHFNDKSIKYMTSKNNLIIMKMSTRCLEQGVYGLIQSILNAMGWKRNEFYEALKGNMMLSRIFHLIVQLYIVILLIMPGFLVSTLTSAIGKGPVLKLILKKNNDGMD